MGEEHDGEETEESVEGVRLVNRADAEAALESGQAISRQSQGRLVSLVNYESDEPQSTWADTDEPTPAIRILGGTTERVSSSLRMPETSTAATGTSTTIDDDFDLLDLRASHAPDDDPTVEPHTHDDEGLVMPPQANQQRL